MAGQKKMRSASTLSIQNRFMPGVDRKIRRSLKLSVAAAAALATVLSPAARASNIFLDTTSGATGLGGGATTWDTGTTPVWTVDQSGGTATTNYVSGSDVVFNTSALATITVNGTVVANSLTFQSNFADTIQNGTAGLITLGGGTTPGITVLGGDNAANVISAVINLAAANNAFAVTEGGTGVLTVGAITGTATAGTQTVSLNTISTGGITLNGVIADGTGGGNVGLLVNNLLGATTTLSGANTFSGGIQVKAGTLAALTNTGGSAFRAGTVTLGDTAPDALGVTLNLGGTQGTYNNAIVLNSGTTGAINLTSANLVANSIVLSGGITGTNNFNINGTVSATWTFNSGAINNSGTVTNSSSGTGAVTISGGIGPNVTTITENSTTSALTIGTTALTVNSPSTTLVNAKGTALLTVSGGVGGSGDLILQNNSTTANGITISGSPINNTGNVIVSGVQVTGGGTYNGVTLITANIGGNVNGVTVSSLGGATLQGANTFAGPTIVQSGLLNLNGAAGTLANTSAVSVVGGAIFNLGDATAGNGLANRINSAAPLTLGDSTGAGSLTIGARFDGCKQSEPGFTNGGQLCHDYQQRHDQWFADADFHRRGALYAQRRRPAQRHEHKPGRDQLHQRAFGCRKRLEHDPCRRGSQQQ